MYIKRTLAQTINQASASFPVLLVTGPRQVGKTTLLEACAEKERNYVTLDDLEERNLAKNDPSLFFQRHRPPVIVDEIQYAPELFTTIKILVDKQKQPGMFWLTGSQKFHLVKGVTETLAGRVAIIDLLGLSQAEIDNRADKSSPFIPTSEWIEQAGKNDHPPKLLMDIYTNTWQGAYPKIISDKNMPHDMFYNSYIQTYIQRDVRDLTKVGNEQAFHQLLRATAARTGQLINYANLANDIDIDQKTVKSWLSILETSGIIYLLQPYHSNTTKRLIKTPKLYFLDTGLCAYLTQWSTPEALEAGAMSDAILETYILSEIIKSYWHNGLTPNLYFYRDKDQKEIDLVIEQNNVLYPIEFKKTANPNKTASKHFPVLEKLGKTMGHGAIICLREKNIPLTKKVDAIPVSYI